MHLISSMSKQAFEQTLQNYQENRPPGDKQHLRATDALAGAISPMMLHRVPVAKMFFQGATRLFKLEMSILPCRPSEANRIVVEGYPALVARKLIGKRGYKSDERGKQTIDRAMARREIVDGLCSGKLVKEYGLAVVMTGRRPAELERERGYGIPRGCDGGEGWIVDPFIS